MLTVCLAAAMMFVFVSCVHDKEYYELVGGDPDIDYLEFLSDSTCLFIAPGPVEMVCPYTEKDGVITINVVGFVKGKLTRLDRKTLKGEAPFFEGTWKKTRPPHREDEMAEDAE